MASPMPVAAPVAAPPVQLAHDDFVALLQAIQAKAPSVVAKGEGEVKSFISKVESEVGGISKAAVADVKSFPWGHIVTYVMSVATPIAIHLLGLFGL